MNKAIHLIPARCGRLLLPDAGFHCTVRGRCLSVFSTASSKTTTTLGTKFQYLSNLRMFHSRDTVLNRNLSSFSTSSKSNSFLVERPHSFRNQIFVHTQAMHKPNKEQSPLTSGISVKRPARKKSQDGKEEPDDVLSVTAYAVAEEIYLGDFQKAIEDQGLYVLQELPVDVTDALFVRAKYKVAEQPREIFFFREGSAIFWNVPDVERREVIKFIQKNCTGPYNMSHVIQEYEHMYHKYVSSETTLSGDTILLCEGDQEQITLEKYAFSNALSQSVKLAMWEGSLEKIADLLEPVTQELRDGLKIRMSRRDVLQIQGELFSLRHSINLSSDLLDTPDFYWDRAVLELQFQRACTHLNIQRRTKVMNEKLSHCCELAELLSSQLTDVHHTRLEWMIIILILVEVMFEVAHYAERYYLAHSHDMFVEDEEN